MMQSPPSQPKETNRASRVATGDGPLRVPESLVRQLATVRRSLQFGRLTGAFARAVAWLLVIVSLDLVIDRYWRLSGSARAAGLALMALALGYGWLRTVWRPLRQRLTNAAICAAVEQLLPRDDRVIVACVELVEAGTTDEHAVSRSLVAATVQRADEVARQVDFRVVLDRRRVWGRTVAAFFALVVLSAVTIGCATQPLLNIWFRRNVQLASVAWPQQTYLQVVGAESGHMRIARGAAATLRVIVTSESVDVPEGIEAEYSPRRARPSQAIRRTGPREFQLLLRGALDPFRLRISGNDAVTEWLSIEPVEPPPLKSLELTLEWPAYLGGSRVTLDPLQVAYSAPRGSVLHLRGQSAPTLAVAALRTGSTRVPLQVTDEGSFSGEVPADTLVTGRYTVELRDRDGLEANPPPSFVIDLQPDLPPQVEADWIGASRLITPRARLAVQVRARDQFAVRSVRAEARRPLDAGVVGSTGGSSTSGMGQVVTYERVGAWPLVDNGNQQEVTVSHELDLEPIQLVPGTTIGLSCVARDAYDLGEPNEGRSAELLLRVVRDEELQTDLLNREKQQRQQLEQVVDDEESLLSTLRDRMPGEADGLSATLAQELIELRRHSGVLANNVAEAAERLNALLVEARHNRLEAATAQLSQRLGQRVVPALRRLTTEMVAEVHAQLDQVGQTGLAPADVRKCWQQAIEAQQRVVQHLRSAVAELARVESFQEAVQMLHEIRVAEQEIVRRVADERRERARQTLDKSGESPGETQATKPSDSTPSNAAKTVREGSETMLLQQRVQRQWDEFEIRCATLVESLRESEAERSERLERTLSVGRERRVGPRLAQMVERLQRQQLDQADADGAPLVVDLRELLNILLNRRGSDESGNALQEELRRQFAEMLNEQRKWSGQTREVAAGRSEDGTWRRAERLALGRIAAGEQQLATQADTLEKRLNELDGAVVLNVAVRELRQHWTTLAKELAVPRVDAHVVGRQKTVEELLAELAGVLRTEADASADAEETPQEALTESDQTQAPLVSQLAELKLLRAAQARLLRQTQTLDGQREAGAAEETIKQELDELLLRQDEIAKLVERLLMP